MQLICFPFSGGNKYSYREFERHLPPGISLVPVELPGRGSRIRENFLVTFDEAIDDLLNQVGHLLHRPYAIFGHSMGAILGYMLTKRILWEKRPAPLHLFVSGAAAPSVNEPRQYHLLSKEKFTEKLRSMGGIPEELLHDEKLMEFFEPILRADFRLLDSFNYTAGAPFSIPITAMNGLEDKPDITKVSPWQLETTQPLVIKKFPGNHFYIFPHAKEIMEIVAKTLAKSLSLHTAKPL